MSRLLEISDPSLFHADAVATSFEGREELSNHFEYFLTIDSPKPAITPSEVIGKPFGLQLKQENSSSRHFHGFISHLWAGDYIQSKDNQALPSRVYRIRIVPWSWFMTRAARSFVYLPEKQEKSIQEVLDRLMQHVREYGHVEPWFEPAGAYILKNRKVEHCVQYRESDYAFLARTLERYGVYYYFRHESSKHTMVLSDKNAYPTLPESEIDYPNSYGNANSVSRILEWHHAYEFVSGKWSQTDYDFKNPSMSLQVEASKGPAVALATNSGYELYDFPNDYVRKGDGREEAHRRQEEEEVRFNTVTGRSSCGTMVPGYVFKLKSHFNSPGEAGKSYLLTSVEHRATQPGRWTSSDQAEHYVNRFTCIPKEMQFRPRRATPQPQLSSIQTAMVVGPKGEEIYTDEYGRVKVQFHWDREGKRDENTSCWIRVSQAHAGKSFGGIDIPRIGEEVVVSFLEGDPDRPLITGRVYHQEAMPPFSLPGEKTRSGLKSQTYKGAGYNEISMDDTAGKEQLRINAQYNMNSNVNNDQTLDVGKNQTEKVGVDRTREVGNNEKVTVGVNKSVSVGTNHDETVGVNQTVTVGKNQTTKIGIAKTEMIGVTANQLVGVAKTNTVGVVMAQTIGAILNSATGFISSEQVGMNKNVVVGNNQSHSIGNQCSLNVGTDLKIVAGSKIEITCGGCSIVMDAGGNMTINASSQCVINGGGATIVMKGGMIDLN